jgi:phosphatidylethanolamine/phosphatidyl-N-methylethanolamine N-methyltransferase
MSDNPAMRFVEKRLAPLAGKIGFHADFPLEPFIRGGRLDVREVRPSNLFGYWKLLRCINNKLPNG